MSIIFSAFANPIYFVILTVLIQRNSHSQSSAFPNLGVVYVPQNTHCMITNQETLLFLHVMISDYSQKVIFSEKFFEFQLDYCILLQSLYFLCAFRTRQAYEQLQCSVRCLNISNKNNENNSKPLQLYTVSRVSRKSRLIIKLNLKVKTIDKFDRARKRFENDSKLLEVVYFDGT